MTAAAAPPPPPTPAAVAVAPPPPQAQRVDPNKAFVPPANWAPPAPAAPATQMAAAAPPPPGAAPQASLSVVIPANRGRQLAIIQFDRGSAELDANDNAVLTKVAAIVKGNAATIRIVGHAAVDAFSSSPAELANDNYDISRRRALIVADQLIRLGVPRDRIIAEAASDSEPAWETTSERGQTANRRVEIFLDF
jgi:outer membrane protein OmpA-like peptidoglycan-associated protein